MKWVAWPRLCSGRRAPYSCRVTVAQVKIGTGEEAQPDSYAGSRMEKAKVTSHKEGRQKNEGSGPYTHLLAGYTNREGPQQMLKGGLTGTCGLACHGMPAHLGFAQVSIGSHIEAAAAWLTEPSG
jgi:hypothetical protein